MQLQKNLLSILAVAALSTSIHAEDKAPIKVPHAICGKELGILQNSILQLGNKDYQERKAAIQALTKFGNSSIPYLKEALKNKDPEISQNAKLVLAEITPIKIEEKQHDPCMKCGRG